MKKALVALSLVVFTAGTTFAAPKYVEKGGFDAAIVGKVISSKTAKGNPFTATFKGDGTGDFQQKGKKAAHFKWSIDGSTVCWDFGDFKECNMVEVITPKKANFYNAKTGNLNNTYSIK